MGSRNKDVSGKRIGPPGEPLTVDFAALNQAYEEAVKPEEDGSFTTLEYAEAHDLHLESARRRLKKMERSGVVEQCQTYRVIHGQVNPRKIAAWRAVK